MAVVFVVAEDWMLRTAVRAELRERGIHALGLETAEDVGRALAQGEMPSAIVIDGNAPAASDPAVQKLSGRIPAIVIAPRNVKIALGSAAKILFRPVQVREIVSATLQVLQGRAA